MSKRRRTSSIASRGHEDDSLDSIEASTSSGPLRKRSKKMDPMELCHQLYDSIRNHKKDDGTLLCDSFIRVPKRRQEPGYYEVVTNPIDLLKVQQKLKTEEYEDIEDLQSDIELIVSNTKAFYKKSSQEHRDASELWELFLANKHKLLTVKEEEPETKAKIVLKVGRPKKSGTPVEVKPDPKMDLEHSEDTSESSNFDDDVNVYEELFSTVMTGTDGENRPLHTYFQLLPSKKRYPEYYEVIETPIDLKIIATKIQTNEYANLAELEKDLLLMTKNACLFNEPGSQIYKNAKALKKIIQSKKIELDQTKFSIKASERIRNKRLRGSVPLSAVTAALKDDEIEAELETDEPVDDESVTDPIDSENPQWQLFEVVKSVTSNTGVSLSEPFWKLPSRRFYPDYYREIKNPVSLTQIKKKLTNSAYGTVSEVAGDLTVMFENAKKYNLPTSRLYKDAIKLQKVMQMKVQELLDIDQVTYRVTNKNRKETDSEDSEVVVRKKPGPKPKNATPVGTVAQRGRPPKDTIPLKKRLHALTKYMLDYVCEDGRKPMLGFMEKPSKKLYSEYYEVISEPIDFLEIESKIRADQYSSEHDLLKDFKLMFSNCRQFNEENSPIYEDSLVLEKYLVDKIEQIPTPEKKERSVARVVKPKKIISPVEKNLRQLYDAIRDYREPKANRQLALIFMKLPSKVDYPDYYEVIRNPIDMEKIAQKLKNNNYEALEELVSDFILMFDNACKYNEPDSQIYKDALMLQNICLQTKTKLQSKEDDDTVPDVAAAVQDILLNLFTTVYNHQDTDERCYTDSLADLPEHDDVDGKKVRAVSLDLIKRRLDRGLYKRLDTFQEDVFACLERARRLSRSDSQVFEDSVELQSYFIKQRDELCKNGELLQSPALNYTLMDLNTAVESNRQSKLLEESIEEETETRSSDDSIIKETSMGGDSMICNQQTFKVGDFVYLDSKEKGCDPQILLIERLWTNNGQQMLYGSFYVRPAETYHVTTRKFLEKEVFKSDTHIAVPLEEVKERCCVLNIKQYFTMRVEGFDEKDVYVCESRYSTKSRSFKKMKLFPESAWIKLVPRDVALEPKRVVSVFRERIEKHKDELAELQEQEKLIEKDKPNVVVYTVEDGNTYYEQYNTICSGVVKTGDFVYVAAEGGRQMIAQIDSIWDTKDDKCYFRGPWYVTPSDVPQSTNKTYYKQEVFLSSMEDTNLLVSIVGKCAVLEFNDYISCRPTEVQESDVFICNSMYDEINRQIRKLPADGIKKVFHSNLVTEDEVYYFPRLINPPKVCVEMCQVQPDVLKSQGTPIHMEVEPSPQLTKMNDMDMLMDDSLDGGPPSVGSGEIPAVIATPGNSALSTPVTSKKKLIKNKVVTGYILYSREVRKQIVQNNPDSNFGEISRIVGNEWRSLPANEKQPWEERASKLNEETKAMLLLDEQCASPAPTPNPDTVFECLWDNCDYQFEDLQDCLEHCVKDKDKEGHVQNYFQTNSDAELHCLWKNCVRYNKKNVQPFPNLARLVRHVRDMHINKGKGRVIPQNDRSKNYKPSSKPAAVSRPTPTATPNPSATNTVNSTPGPQPTTNNTASTGSSTAQVVVVKQEPLFITVPPRPQRVLHSEAYIKYIEGLSAENKFISPWERNLCANQENTPIGELDSKLQNVTTWLGKKTEQQDVLSALWSLRGKLLRDSLCLQKTLVKSCSSPV